MQYSTLIIKRLKFEHYSKVNLNTQTDTTKYLYSDTIMKTYQIWVFRKYPLVGWSHSEDSGEVESSCGRW